MNNFDEANNLDELNRADESKAEESKENKESQPRPKQGRSFTRAEKHIVRMIICAALLLSLLGLKALSPETGAKAVDAISGRIESGKTPAELAESFRTAMDNIFGKAAEAQSALSQTDDENKAGESASPYIYIAGNPGEESDRIDEDMLNEILSRVDSYNSSQ